ncbi:MAG: hypothetical protein KC422_13820 [Trueperaceae bacterium]|nr:hypothetical protein [Trueperaceae bacterium]
MTHSKAFEVWRQDTQNSDLWHGPKGVIVNTTALNERHPYYEIITIPVASTVQSQNYAAKPHVLN